MVKNGNNWRRSYRRYKAAHSSRKNQIADMARLWREWLSDEQFPLGSRNQRHIRVLYPVQAAAIQRKPPGIAKSYNVAGRK